MPLVIGEKDVNWSESVEKIKIIVSFQRRIDSKISVLNTSRYLKVSCPPYIWECFLAFAVNTSCSIIRIGDNQVSFELKKDAACMWRILEHENRNCKFFQKEQRDQAFDENQKRLEDTKMTLLKKKEEIRQASVRRQMLLDDKERNMIEKEKKLECEKMAKELEEKQQENEKALRQKLFLQKAESFLKELPPTRKPGRIAVTFTPRVFPTAARESQNAEEQEWLQKQAKAAGSLQIDMEGLSPEERNPDWLERKAKFLLDKGDYRGAVNAINLAIRICPNKYSLYIIRADCNLHLRNLHKCVEDTSKALDLLKPPVNSNASARGQCHILRGEAFSELSLPVEALMDYEAALKIDPSDEKLQKNADTLRSEIQTYDSDDD